MQISLVLLLNRPYFNIIFAQQFSPYFPPPFNNREIAFGAHTDTSFISIGLCSSEPGLEILDKKSYEWVCPENFVMAPADKNGDITAFNPSSDIDKDKVRNIGGGGGGIFGLGLKDDDNDGMEGEEEEEELRVPVSPTIAVVFLGEFLQVLTGGKFSATPHRVRCLPTTSPSNSSASSPAGKGSSVRGLHSPFTLMSSTHNSPDTDNNNSNSSSHNNSNNNINNNNNNDNTAHGCSYYNILDTATSKCTEKSPPHVLNIPAPQKAQNFLPDILQTPPSKNVLPVKNIFPTKNIPPTPTSITSLSSINSSDQISPHPKLKNVLQRSPLSVLQSVLKKVPFGLKFSKAVIDDKKKMPSLKKGNALLKSDKGQSRYESNNDTEDNSILLSTRKESFRSEYDVAVRTHCDAPVSVPLPASVTENGTAYVIEKRTRAMSDVSVNSNPSLMTKHNREPLKNNPVFRSRRKPTYKIDSDVTAFSVDMNDITPLPQTPLPQYCDARKYKMVPTSYRVSCPFIIRGKHTAVINIRNKNYQHKNWGALGLNFKANTSEKEDKENINRNTTENKNISPTSTTTSNNNNNSNNNSPDSERESIYTPGQTKKWIMPDLDGTSMLLIHKLLDMKRKRCANMHESSDSDWVLSAFPVQPPAIPESDDCDESRLL